MNLTELANQSHSDKGTKHGGPPHRYTLLYDLIFYPLKERRIKFLEMGLAIGGPEVGGPVDRHIISPSISMWLEYFPNAMIYGFDISDFSHMKNQRFKFVRGDSGSVSDMDKLRRVATHFDVVIDDASHASYHQQRGLAALWDAVPSGGLYIIEDLQWQSPAFESDLPDVPKTTQLLRSAFEQGEFIPSPVIPVAKMKQIVEQSYSFSAFHNYDGIEGPTKQIVIRKK